MQHGQVCKKKHVTSHFGTTFTAPWIISKLAKCSLLKIKMYTYNIDRSKLDNLWERPYSIVMWYCIPPKRAGFYPTHTSPYITQKKSPTWTHQEHLGRCLRYPTPSIQEGQRICRTRNCEPSRLKLHEVQEVVDKTVGEQVSSPNVHINGVITMDIFKFRR